MEDQGKNKLNHKSLNPKTLNLANPILKHWTPHPISCAEGAQRRRHHIGGFVCFHAPRGLHVVKAHIFEFSNLYIIFDPQIQNEICTLTCDLKALYVIYIYIYICIYYIYTELLNPDLGSSWGVVSCRCEPRNSILLEQI